MEFGARQTKKGVSAKVWGKRRVYNGTISASDAAAVAAYTGEVGAIANATAPALVAVIDNVAPTINN